MQQSYFPPVKPIESSIAWRFVMVAAVVVILVNLLPGNDTASSSPTRTHSRVQV
ncbi:elongation factor P [Burkholderia pseudomallei 305]|nr:elongation factor P [Burkholderia pseudomallei 305]